MKLKFYHKHPVLTGFGLIAIFLSISYWLILNLVQHEKQQDYSSWQITLGVMADNRTNDINQWISKQFATLNKLAQNGSIQLYSQQLQRRTKEKDQSEPAQVSYLRNLLKVTAGQNDFKDYDTYTIPIPANISKQANNGLALLNIQGEIITATSGINPPTGNLKQTLLNVIATGQPQIVDIHINNNNRPQIGFMAPIFALQVQTGKREAIAALYGFKEATDTLFALIKSNSKATKTAETMLVRQEADTVKYITPLADGTAALTRSLSLNDTTLAAAYALTHTGSFAERHDYAGRSVLFTSRQINDLPWLLVQKIEVDEALSEANSSRNFLLMSLCLTTMIVTLLFIAAWWYGATVRAKKTAHELLKKSGELETKTKLLKAINATIKDFVFVADEDARLLFVNDSLAQQLHSTAKSLITKSVPNVFGPDAAKQFIPLLTNALNGGDTQHQELSLDLDGITFKLHATITSMNTEIQGQRAVLITCHDVTQLHEAQKAQASLMAQLIKAMMRAIDLHDPYSANHSSKTAAIAKQIGQEMNLDFNELSTLETAANLCNIGKLFLPKAILTKSNPLSKEEEEILQQETDFAAKILSGIQFLGPVQETITQKHEHVDGAGYPRGINGTETLQTSKILAVANAFVAMISPRAYRGGVTEQEAMEQILQKANKQFDRKVIAALFHVVENKINWADWPSPTL